MTGDAVWVWWLWLDDGAVHAISQDQTGRGRVTLETACEQHISVWRLRRSELGPRCMTCTLAVGEG